MGKTKHSKETKTNKWGSPNLQEASLKYWEMIQNWSFPDDVPKLHNDTILNAYEQSYLIDGIFKCGEKTKITAYVPVSEKDKEPEPIEANYYKATKVEKSDHKRDIFTGSFYEKDENGRIRKEDEFKMDFAKWVTLGQKIVQFENRVQELPNDYEIWEDLKADRYEVWEKIYPVLTNVGLVKPEPEQQNRLQAILKETERLKNSSESQMFTEKPPIELSHPKAKKILKKAVETGFCEVQGDFYKWNESKQLLAYFAEKMSLYLELKKGNLDKDGKQKIYWKPFEQLFRVKRIQSAKASWLKLYSTFNPPDFERIDLLFEAPA